MTYDELKEFCKGDKRKEVQAVTQSGAFDFAGLSDAQCRELLTVSGVKVTRELIKAGLNVNFDNSDILARALETGSSTFSYYLYLAEKHGQTVLCPDGLKYSVISFSIKYLREKHVRYLLQLQNFPIESCEIYKHIGHLGNRYSGSDRIKAFEKFLIGKVPDSQVEGLLKEVAPWAMRSNQLLIARRVAKDQRLVSDKKTGKAVCHYDVITGYKWVQAEALSMGEYTEAVKSRMEKPLQNSNACLTIEECSFLLNHNQPEIQRIADYVIEHMNARDSDKRTALIRAVTSDDQDLTKQLIDAGADLEPTDASGMNAFVHAVICNNLPAVQLLIDAGADVDGEYDLGGKTMFNALRAAIVFGNEPLIKILRDAGAKEIA